MTKFDYVCFISYRNAYEVEGHLTRFTRTLAEEISDKAEAYLPDSVVRDTQGRNIFLDQYAFPNYVFNVATLSQGLCKSIVWIVLYSRNYLSGSLWCASELHGMSSLEALRLQLLNASANPDFGFVVPVIITGTKEEMPPFLKKNKHHIVDLSKIYIRKGFPDADEFTDALTGLLDKIGRVQQAIIDGNVDICCDCVNFSLKDINQEAEKSVVENFVVALKTPPQPGI